MTMMPNKMILLALLTALYIPKIVFTQHSTHHGQTTENTVVGVEPQPLLAQALRLREALSFLGSSLSDDDEKRLLMLQNQPLTEQVVHDVQAILDPYCLARVDINPEARVKVERGLAKAKLI